MFNQLIQFDFRQMGVLVLASLFNLHNCYTISPPSSNANAWFTGTLLTPAGKVIKENHFNVEPYLFWTVFNGRYENNWENESRPKLSRITSLVPLKAGLTDRLDCSILFQVIHNRTQGVSSTNLGDLPIGIDFQIIPPDGDAAVLKLTFQEIFPTGRFQGLDPNSLRADAGGSGSFITLVGLTGAKLFHLTQKHYLSTRAHIALAIPTAVHVKGHNIYGGDPLTRGIVFPGNSLRILLGNEFTLTKNWVIALDIVGEFTDKVHFEGYTKTHVGLPSAVQFSLAPAIEYNWDQSIGMIIGTWFTVAGKNCNSFISFIGAVNMFF